jgi:hypothetical protein
MNVFEELLCESANGKRIVFDPESSHTATHFNDTANLRASAFEVLSGMELGGELIATDIDMGKPIGNTDVVEVSETDIIIYAMRTLREDQGYVPFTKSRSTEPSTFISVYLMQKDTDTYELLSTWIGTYENPPFPR